MVMASFVLEIRPGAIVKFYHLPVFMKKFIPSGGVLSPAVNYAPNCLSYWLKLQYNTVKFLDIILCIMITVCCVIV